MAYIRVPLETDPATLTQSVYDTITASSPNWLPSDGNLDVWIIKAMAQLASETRDLASDVQDDIFRYFGANLVGVQPIDAVSASGTTTWTCIDSLGHLIPAGTLVGVVDPAGNIQPFQTVVDVTVPVGNTATAAGAVQILAVNPGSAANSLGGAGVTCPLIDVLDWVQGVTLTAPTAGGVDDETDEVYLSRLVRKLQGLSQRPILPNDFASMTLDASTEVARAVAIDGFNPADSTYNNQRMVSVAAITSLGQPVSVTAKTAIDSYLQANREVNFIVNVINPNYTTINITCTVVNVVGYVDSAVDSAIQGAIHNYLDPQNWGVDPTIQGEGGSSTWIETPILYYNELLTAISNTTGVARVTALTINGGTANINLTTPAALTQVGTIAITHA